MSPAISGFKKLKWFHVMLAKGHMKCAVKTGSCGVVIILSLQIYIVNYYNFKYFCDMHITKDFLKLCWLLALFRFARCLKFQRPSSVEETENTRHAYYKGHIRRPLIPPGVLSKFTNNDEVPFIMKAERFHGHLFDCLNEPSQCRKQRLLPRRSGSASGTRRFTFR